MLAGQKTYIGLAIAAAAALAQALGVSFEVAEVDLLGNSIMTIAGIAFAAYGRWKARPV